MLIGIGAFFFFLRGRLWFWVVVFFNSNCQQTYQEVLQRSSFQIVFCYPLGWLIDNIFLYPQRESVRNITARHAHERGNGIAFSMKEKGRRSWRSVRDNGE